MYDSELGSLSTSAVNITRHIWAPPTCLMCRKDFLLLWIDTYLNNLLSLVIMIFGNTKIHTVVGCGLVILILITLQLDIYVWYSLIQNLITVTYIKPVCQLSVHINDDKYSWFFLLKWWLWKLETKVLKKVNSKLTLSLKNT